MDTPTILFDKTKEELVDIILKQDQRIKDLEEKLKESEAKKKQKELPKFIKPNLRKRHCPPGQKEGHKGSGRFLPQRVDETIDQTLAACPHCHNGFKEPAEIVEHTQEDIIPAQVKVTKYRQHRYWCRHCQKFVDAPYHETEMPDAKIGPNVLIHAAILKYNHCLPYDKIAELFKELSGLYVSAGALAQGLQRLSRWLNVEQQTILDAIRAGPYVHIDETGWRLAAGGWRLDGKNH